MMTLVDLWNATGRLLGSCTNFLPKIISKWNRTKEPIDDLSKIQSHNLGENGPVRPMNVIWVRVVSTMMYNTWRLCTLSTISNEIHSMTSYEKFLRIVFVLEDF